MTIISRMIRPSRSGRFLPARKRLVTDVKALVVGIALLTLTGIVARFAGYFVARLFLPSPLPDTPLILIIGVSVGVCGLGAVSSYLFFSDAFADADEPLITRDQ